MPPLPKTGRGEAGPQCRRPRAGAALALTESSLALVPLVAELRASGGQHLEGRGRQREQSGGSGFRGHSGWCVEEGAHGAVSSGPSARHRRQRTGPTGQ